MDFEPDHYLDNVKPSSLRDGCYDETISNSSEGELRFGLPLVAAWRSFPESLEPHSGDPSKSFAAFYRKLAKRSSSCFLATSGFDVNYEPEAHYQPVSCVSFCLRLYLYIAQ